MEHVIDVAVVMLQSWGSHDKAFNGSLHCFIRPSLLCAYMATPGNLLLQQVRCLYGHYHNMNMLIVSSQYIPIDFNTTYIPTVDNLMSG